MSPLIACGLSRNLDFVGKFGIRPLLNQTPDTERWSSASCRGVRRRALLSAPNPDDPLANDVADKWKTDETGAMNTAAEWTKKFAVG